MSKCPKILFDATVHSLSYFEEQLKAVVDDGVKGITFFIAAHYPHIAESMNAFLKNIPVPISGGVFPEVIYKGEYFSEGIIAILWCDETKVQTFTDASNVDSPLYHQQGPIFDNTRDTTSLVFSNTKTRAAEAALDALYYRTGQSIQYAGGGSTYALGHEGPSIVTNDGLVEDALQVTFFPYQQKSEVGHGWSILSGPHLVTESEENKIKTLDYQATRPHYESLIRSSLGDEVKDLSFHEISNTFPIGIQPYDDTMIIRAISSYGDDEMCFVGDIPEFSSVYILAGKQEKLLDFMEDSAEKFRSIASEKPNLSLIISCIGRRLHMAESSDKELAILTDSLGNREQVIGFASEGEIASNSTGLACLHSMTMVVANIWI